MKPHEWAETGRTERSDHRPGGWRKGWRCSGCGTGLRVPDGHKGGFPDPEDYRRRTKRVRADCDLTIVGIVLRS